MDSDRVFEGEEKRPKCLLFLYVCELELDRVHR